MNTLVISHSLSDWRLWFVSVCTRFFVLRVFACFLGMCVCLVMLYLSLFLAATSTRLWCGPPTLCLLHLQPITWQGNAPISCLCFVSCDCACHSRHLLFFLPPFFLTIESSHCLVVTPWPAWPFPQSSVGLRIIHVPSSLCYVETWVMIQVLLSFFCCNRVQ